ncbi:hypothetical protein EJ110_NYTH22421 [Nymphaea thermarum]|nr:hypothetical protein EJ110_NYTH22421 [Nymphaea thermarum]
MTFGTSDLSPAEGTANLEITGTWCLFSWLQAGEGAEWWSGETVAVVTGANRGIGLEICRQLVGKGLTVIMTARKPREQLSSSAQQFLQEAAEMGRKNVIFHTLDTTQEQSVLDFVDWLKSLDCFVDILVHPTWTEGISEKYESAKDCIETNFYGTKRLTKALLPLLRPSSYKPRIINVSSNYGLSCHLRDEELRGQLCDTMGLTEQKVDGVLAMFLDAVKSEKGMEKWPLKFPSYSISKIALNAYTRLLALELGDKACVNSVHPGYVITDMTFGSGDLNPAEGAANLVHSFDCRSTMVVTASKGRGVEGALCDTMGLTEQKIDGVLAMFLDDVKLEKGMEKWPLKFPSYSISKMALNAYTRLLALELGDKACVNSVHPGYVITDMTFGSDDLSPAEGAANLDYTQVNPPCLNGILEMQESAKDCIETNFYGIKRLTKALLPLLRASSCKLRIVNVSSVYGLLLFLRDDELRKQLNDTGGLTEQKIDELSDMFLEDRAWRNDPSSFLLIPSPRLRTGCLFSWLQAGEGAEWWSGETVAVVTGANRGIGLEICRQLAGKGLIVIMTARKPQEQLSSSAQQFLQEAAEMGRKNVIFHNLDTTQEQSVLDFVDWLKSLDWFVDILVNNAGVLSAVIDWDFMKRDNIDTRTIVAHPTWTEGISEKYESAKHNIETNFYGTKRLTKALLPLLRPSSYKPRIVNVSSCYGLSCHLRDKELKEQLCDTMGLTEQKIDGVLAMFLDDVKSEKGMEKWPLKFPSYFVSKMALNAYTRLLALELGDKACVNSVQPGYVMTDMTFGSGDLSPAEGAANLFLQEAAQLGRKKVIFHTLDITQQQSAGEGAEWWSGETVAVVTGANRGIGLEVCRQLAGMGLTVIMTARKPQEQLSSFAQQFLQEAAQMGRKNVVFHTLDTTQDQSVLDFVDWLKSLDWFVDILVNNAGVLSAVIDWDFMKRDNIDTRTIVINNGGDSF